MTKPVREYCRTAERFGAKVISVESAKRHYIVVIQNPQGMRMVKTLSASCKTEHAAIWAYKAELKRFMRNESHGLKILPREVI